MILRSISKTKCFHQIFLFFLFKPFQVIFGQFINCSVVPYQMWVSWFTFVQLWLDEIKVFCKLYSMVDFNPQLNLLKIRIRYHNFPQDAWPNHLDEGFHFLVVGVQRVWHNVINFVRRLMFKHQKVCIDTDETLSKWSCFGILNDLSSSFFAYEPDVTFFRICCQEICSETCNQNFL